MKEISIIHLNTFVRAVVATTSVAFITGCASHPKEATIQERGWIGGRYECAKARRTVSNYFFGADRTMFCLPSALSNVQSAAMLTLSVGTNTPAFQAGLREGDLILELGGRLVTNIYDFRAAVACARPGALLPVKIFRDGQTMEKDVTVGREKYERMGSLAIGVPGWIESLHPIPTHESPNFSLIALGFQRDDTQPVEFGSVKERYRQSCHPKSKPEGYDGDWRLWLAVIEVTKGKKILAQETVVAEKSGP